MASKLDTEKVYSRIVTARDDVDYVYFQDGKFFDGNGNECGEDGKTILRSDNKDADMVKAKEKNSKIKLPGRLEKD